MNQNNLGIITNEAVSDFLQKENLIYDNDLENITIENNVLNLFDMDLIKKYQILPLKIENTTLKVLVSIQNMNIERDIKNELRNELKKKSLQLDIDIVYTPADIKRVITRFYNLTFSISKRNVNIFNEEEYTPVKNKVMKMIDTAIERNVSDIHILPTEGGVIVGFRINGSLKDVSDEFKFTEDQRLIIANIAKGLDTSGQADAGNTLMPAQGSFEYVYGNKTVNIRISTVPTALGFEKIALRLLVRKNDVIKLEQLGYFQEDIDVIRTVNQSCTNGLFITAGPTGSGKTTVIFSQLYDEVDRARERYNEMKNVMTIENPVEILEPRFAQVQERLTPDNKKLNMDAVLILETFLRQDPDIILFGEIRSRDDADVATKAGQTGHKVYATVHANDCVTTILRLLDLGVSKVSLLEQIRIIMSQRLVKLLCPHCCRDYTLSKTDKIILTKEEYDILSKSNLKTLGRPEDVANCPYCKGSGYLKRMPVLEYIVFNDELRDIFMEQQIKYSAINEVLKKYRFKSMWDKIFDYIKSGRIDLGEAIGSVGNKTATNNIINYLAR